MAAPADDSKSRRPMSPDHLLPPVEPPSAGFLVQLFLVPGLIVAIIVGVWLTFHWLAHLGQDPQAYVRTLRRDNEGRWQAALNLANDLRGPGGAVLKADATLAGELGRILADESKSGRTGEQSQMLRVYLCRALGEFTIPEALAPLLERAQDTAQPQVARAAIEAIVRAVQVPCELGGGIRDRQTIQQMLDLGLKRLVIGTKALKDPSWFQDMCRTFPGRLAVGIDARDGRFDNTLVGMVNQPVRLRPHQLPPSHPVSVEDFEQ
jgi:hypothetical protein